MIYTIINQKGGVGKTTSTFNLGHTLARLYRDSDKKVLIIDLDPQFSLTIASGVFGTTKSMYNVMCSQNNQNKMFLSDIIKKINCNLYLAPSSQYLALSEMELVNEYARETVLKRAIKKLETQYETILIDCPPSINLLTVNALVASDEIIVPCATDVLSYKGLELITMTYNNIISTLNENLKFTGVIATMYDKRTCHSKEVLELLKEKFNVLGVIKHSTIVKDSIANNEPIFNYIKNNDISNEYERIAKEVIIDGK